MQLVNLSRVTLNHRGISNMQFSSRYTDTKIHLQKLARNCWGRTPYLPPGGNKQKMLPQNQQMLNSGKEQTSIFWRGVWNYVRYRKWNAPNYRQI